MIRGVFGSISLLSFGAIALWACHSSSSSVDDTSGGLSGACQRVANATSSFAQKCGESLTAFGASDHDKHDIERSAASCVAQYSLPGIPDQTSALNACASALNAAACNTAGFLPACTIAPVGTFANGTSCVENSQCTGGICLFSVNDAGLAADAAATPVCGACATAIAPGQPCTDFNLCLSGNCQGSSASNIVCEPGLTVSAAIGESCGEPKECAPPGFCDSSGTCVPAAKLGGSCGAANTSDSTTPCEPPLTCTNGVCTAAAALGGDCTTSTCALGLFCGGNGTCLAVTYGPPGASCDGAGLRCIQGNCPNGSPFGPPTAVCPKIIADGQPCTPGVSIPSCDSLATCNNGICGLIPTSSGCQ